MTRQVQDPKECWYQYLTDACDDHSTAFHGIASAAMRKEEIPFGVPYTLWDAERGFISRDVSTNWLDRHARTRKELISLINQAKASQVQELVIHDDRRACGNPIYQLLSQRTIDAFRTVLQRSGIACRIVTRTHTACNA